MRQPPPPLSPITPAVCSCQRRVATVRGTGLTANHRLCHCRGLCLPPSPPLLPQPLRLTRLRSPSCAVSAGGRGTSVDKECSSPSPVLWWKPSRETWRRRPEKGPAFRWDPSPPLRIFDRPVESFSPRRGGWGRHLWASRSEGLALERPLSPPARKR